MIKRFLVYLFFGAVLLAAGFFLAGYLKKTPVSNSNLPNIIPNPKPLEKYTFENLKSSDVKPGTITIDSVLSDEKTFTSYLFTFFFDPNMDGKESKKITGMLNIPKNGEIFPLVLMLRGYVDQKIYQTGVGSKNASYFLAENGFITVAPDFLGYSGSDKEADNIFESRFQTYTTTLALLSTLEKDRELTTENGKLKIGQIGIWGHSNGGQIALTVLEITGKNIPTVLWAPVSKPFPYSILYYTDESEDRGKLIRHELAKFEEIYDVEKFSLTNYWGDINKDIKIQIHQGTSDDAVPVVWTNTLVNNLKEQEIPSDYYLYPGADHNLKPAWDLAIERSLQFFKSNLD